MAGIEELYQTILGRSADTGGLSFWQGQQAGGMSMDQIAGYFYQSDEFQARLAYQQQYDPAAAALSAPATPAAPIPGSVQNPSSTVLGIDVSGLRWDDLAADVHSSMLQQSNTKDSYDMYSGYASSQLLGGALVQGYRDTSYTQRPVGVRADDWGVNAFDVNSLTAINFKDREYAPEGYMTALYRKEDGGVGVHYYEEKNGMLKDAVLFAAAAFAMYTGVTALAEMAGGSVTSGASGTAGTGASGTGAVGEVSTQTLTQAAVPASETGFQVTQLTAPWESVAPNTLGSGTYGIEAVDGLLQIGTVTPEGVSVGGMTLTSSGEVITAGSSFSASQGASTLPWVNPANTTITDVVINSSGSVTNMLNGTGVWDVYQQVHTTGLPPTPDLASTPSTPPTTTPTAPPGTDLVDKALDIAKDIGTGLVVGAVVDAAVGKPSTPTSPTGPGSTVINIPKPDPAASALQPASSQRAGVKFGRTKSKRQLKGKFSGTGINL